MAYMVFSTPFNQSAFTLGAPFLQDHTLEPSLPGGGGGVSNAGSVGIGGLFFEAVYVAAFSAGYSYNGTLTVVPVSSDQPSVKFLGVSFGYDETGLLNAGRVRAIEFTTDALGFSIMGLRQDAAELTAAMGTLATDDDQALLARWLRNNDLITLSVGDDSIASGGGDDLIDDAGGRNIILAGAGDDVVNGGANRDKIVGGAGNDYLLGGDGNDALTGGSGDDMIWAGTGDDTVTGGSGEDTFFFATGDGSVEIWDFDADLDRLVFMQPRKALGPVVFEQVGRDTEVTFSDVTVILRGIDAATMTNFKVGAPGNVILHDALALHFSSWEITL